jgi:4'-phosphopantetheinyl transferase
VKTCGIKQDKLISLCRLIDDDRQKKVDKLKNDSEKARSIMAGILLRQAFLKEGHNEQEWKKIVIKTGEYGKPYMENHSDFEYSLSHSGEWVICVTDDNPVGADIQEMKLWKLQLAKRFFDEKEYDRLLHIGKDDNDRQTREFYCMWTAKESAVKLNGRGIGAGISHYVTDEAFRHICDRQTGKITNIKIYDELEGYMVCVCSRTGQFPPNIEIIEGYGD